MSLDSKFIIGEALSGAFMSCAAKNYPNEACGFVVSGAGGKYLFVEARNTSEDPQERFVMHPDDVMAAEDKGDVVAVWHSHTDQPATPSEADLAGCEASQLPWIITAIYKNYDDSIDVDFVFSSPVVFHPTGFEMPYTGRIYAFGVFDCWTLCRDYLGREFGISLNLHEKFRIPNWSEGDVDILGDNFAGEGLVRLANGEEPQKGDIFFMQYGKMPDHCAVYIGDDQILHHHKDRLSCRAVFGGMYKKHVTHHLRHRNLLSGKEKCLN